MNWRGEPLLTRPASRERGPFEGVARLLGKRYGGRRDLDPRGRRVEGSGVAVHARPTLEDRARSGHVSCVRAARTNERLGRRAVSNRDTGPETEQKGREDGKTDRHVDAATRALS
jgi:hypothetical protein